VFAARADSTAGESGACTGRGGRIGEHKRDLVFVTVARAGFIRQNRPPGAGEGKTGHHGETNQDQCRQEIALHPGTRCRGAARRSSLLLVLLGEFSQAAQGGVRVPRLLQKSDGRAQQRRAAIGRFCEFRECGRFLQAPAGNSVGRRALDPQPQQLGEQQEGVSPVEAPDAQAIEVPLGLVHQGRKVLGAQRQQDDGAGAGIHELEGRHAH